MGETVIISNTVRDGLFLLSDSTRCPYWIYSLVKEASVNFTAAELEYNYLLLSTWTSGSEVKFQSTFTPTAGELERRFLFKYCAETRARAKFNQVICKNVEVVIGCFDETTIAASAKTLPALQPGQR